MNAEKTGMGLRYRDCIGRSLAVLVAGVSGFGLTGCGKSSAPEEPAKGVAQVAPVSVAAVSKAPKENSPPVRAAAKRDAALAARVSAALAADARLKSFAIDIRAANGVVKLFGTVDSPSSRETAARLAAAVAGVISVENQIVLVSGS